MNHDHHTPADAHEREIWAFLEKHPRVKSADIAAACAASEWKRQNYLRKLRRDGILKVCGHDKGAPVWTIFDIAGVAEFAASRRGSKEAAIWQAIRVLRTFTPADIAAALMSAVDVTDREIQSYCSLLVRVKYLAVLSKAQAGGRPARYKLVRDTGPLPPVKKRIVVVVDGNEDRVVFAEGERL